ncbi:HAD-like domain-containing protein [Cynara cardunculus var. scolymus]|uniref:HAD-like domain-containing protein n=1 Tax=Cynara cardunculus var. scolymus TaxID=59895 RepID=A0A118K1A1_CYNCS|nr:HAD-like domain-containing protein [Cynara cardunculus var. scolymus]
MAMTYKEDLGAIENGVFNPRISFFSRNPRFVVFDLYAMSSSSSSKIVAEYAKSGKSSCKKCSQKIDSKALRLGLKIRDPRGYDSTKWHHLDCFFSLDSVPVSYTETIEGFSELTGSDQDKLKQMVSEGDQSSTKREGDVELESQRTSSKKLKMDEDEEAGQAKKNVTDEKYNIFTSFAMSSSSTCIKIVAEYAKSGRSSCKKCAEKIDSKSLRLGFSSWDPRGFENTKWHHLDCFFPLDTNLLSAESIEGFSELKSSDQEKLKKLVTEGDQSSKESNEDGETELEGRDQKSGKTDEDEEAGKEKENVKNEKIVAEYAKSGRSLCKKCAEKIDSKSLRLGLTSWDPRGFENTKWHHIDCFFPLDSNLLSAESIEGFSELKSSDQEKLKKLVTEGDQSSKKSNEDGETELAAQDQTSEKISNSLDARVGSEIDFAVSDIKDNYKGATLQPKWKAFRTIVYLERDDGLQDSRKIAAFDFDGCLAKTSVQRVGATAWSLMYASIPKKLQSLYNDGYKLVIFTNESNIERWKNKRQAIGLKFYLPEEYFDA